MNWLRSSPVPCALSPVPYPMVCPNCHSSDVKRVSLIHAAGVYESRGRILGFLAGSGDALLFAKYRGKNQSLLSKLLAPPRKAPYVAPLVLWLVGFFIVMAFAGRGKLSLLIGLISVAYDLALPAYLLAALFYNFVLRPKKYRAWENSFMCQRCGVISTSPERGEPASVASG
jgi:hypothetical protein